MKRSGTIADTVHQLRNTKWPTIINENKLHLAQDNETLQSYFDDFYDILEEAQDANQPLKRVTVRRDKPWINEQIKYAIAIRQKLFNQGKQSELEHLKASSKTRSMTLKG